MSSNLLRFGATNFSRPPGSRVWARVANDASPRNGSAAGSGVPLAPRPSIGGEPAQRLGRLPVLRDAREPAGLDGQRMGDSVTAPLAEQASPHGVSIGAGAASMPAAPVLVQHGDRLWGVKPAPVPKPNAGRAGVAPWVAALPPVRGLAVASPLRRVGLDHAAPDASACALSARHGTQALGLALDVGDLKAYLRRERNRRYHNLPAYLHNLQSRHKAGQPAPVVLTLDHVRADPGVLDIAQLHDLRDAQARFGELVNRVLGL